MRRIVSSAASLESGLFDNNGLDSSTSIFLVRPATASNLFTGDARPATKTSPVANTTALADARAHFVFQPPLDPGMPDRHSKYRSTTTSFALSQYPAVLDALQTPRSTFFNSSSNLDTHNEQGYSVAVGVARPQSTLVVGFSL